MRTLLLPAALLLALPAGAQNITYDWNTGDAADTQGWVYVAETGEGLAEAVEGFANAPMTPIEGARSLEAGPRGDGTTHPLTNQFRGAQVAFDPAIDLSSAGAVSYQFNIYGSSPASAVFEQRFRVIDSFGNASEFRSNVTKNSWTAVSFSFSDLETPEGADDGADLSDIVAIAVDGRNPDGRGNDTFDPWGGRVQIDAFSIARGTSAGDGPGLATFGPVRPNPTAGPAAFDLAVESAQAVRAEVFDALGRRVATAFDGPVAPGAAVKVGLDAAGLAPGLYLVRVQGETFTASRTLTVAR